MEDLFQLIIWLIIIISFFSPFFKKKKKEGSSVKKKPADLYQNKNEETAVRKEDESGHDIMKEIEKLFGVETPKPAETKSTKEERYETEWHQETASEHKLTTSERSMQTKWEEEKQKLELNRKKVNSKIEEEAKSFEKFLNKKKEFDRISLKTFRQSLKHPQSLKEFIVISEILRKPISLRPKSFNRFF